MVISAFLLKTTRVVRQLRQYPPPEQEFDLTPVSGANVSKYLERIELRKATSLDGICSKILLLTNADYSKALYRFRKQQDS